MRIFDKHGRSLCYGRLFPFSRELFVCNDLEEDSLLMFDNADLTDSLTIERSRRPNSAFLHKMLQWVEPFDNIESALMIVTRISNAKTHAIFTDTAHNSPRAVRINVYQAFALTAMKMHAYIRALKHNPGGLAFVPRGSTEPTSGNPDRRSVLIPGCGEGDARTIVGRKTLRGEGAFLLSKPSLTKSQCDARR